ncbi:MAG: hypothetical protein JWP89_2335 [Schlesneria sp.]|nr:hypothetical protein [Schlesneria sp.]
MSFVRSCGKLAATPWQTIRGQILAVLVTSLILLSFGTVFPPFAGEATAVTQPNGKVSDASTAPSNHAVLAAQRHGDYFLVETLNFRIWSRLNSAETMEFTKRCETVRSDLREIWLSESDASGIWTPKADVVVHRSVVEFGAALGPQNAGSSGCTKVQRVNGRITLRRIDLRADAHGWNTSSMSHEVTHLIVADRFGGRRLPRWADEGMAVLAESREKQAQRQRVASLAPAISLSRLLSVAEYPGGRDRDAFYAQSASLTDYLVRHGGGVQFLAFVESAMESGHDIALREYYDLEGLHDLETKLTSKHQ